MLLAEEKIEDVVKDFRKKKLNVGYMKFKVNMMDHQHQSPNLVLHSDTTEGVQQQADYYDNISDNLMALQHQLLKPLYDHLQGLYEVEIAVDDEGHFLMDSVSIKLQLLLPQGIDNMKAHLYTRLQPYCLLYKYIHKMEFKGTRGQLRNVLFHAELNPKEINKIFKQSQVNYNILNHWMTIVHKVCRDIYTDNEHSYSNGFRVVAGKMHYHNRTIRRMKKFTL
ncbi:hypothetical protein [Gracilibacillus sp. YIM 98692]|uniref:hypothetical protein n=1 Tax=Gracilibacillus sp. YIM 98692 TaxID=2663532 RepID=UPI0013D7B67C|nr:hypothetical protein [Gracilibacillus sp. YIM 98692]